MPPLDEMSTAIGELRGEVKLIHEEIKRQGKQNERIDRKLTTLRIKMGTVAGTVSLSVTILILALKDYLFK